MRLNPGGRAWFTMSAPQTAGLRVAALLAVIGLAACDEQPQRAAASNAAAPPPASVTVATLHRKPVPVTADLPGRTTAFRVAEVRPQVGGVLRDRLFTEGQIVEAGQALYQIDPAPFQAALESAEAALTRAEATARQAEITVNRYRPLARVQAVSRQNLDQAETELRQARADVDAARAAVETARINLAYTRVTSPISGHAGRSYVTQGALVTASQATPLVTITQLDPIYVDLTQPASRLLQLRRDIASGVLRREDGSKAAAKLLLEDGSEYPLPGEVQFSEVIVDQGTGSVTLRAVFPNPDGLLMPGMFVRARIEEGVIDRALLVPQQAVMRTPNGQAMTFVVTGENVVEPRILRTSRAIGTDWLVTEGVNEGDRVIVEGVMRVQPGARVNPTEAAQRAADGAPASAAATATGG